MRGARLQTISRGIHVWGDTTPLGHTHLPVPSLGEGVGTHSALETWYQMLHTFIVFRKTTNIRGDLCRISKDDRIFPA